MKEILNKINPVYVFEVTIFGTNNDRKKLVKEAQNTSCDILSLKFDIETIEDIKKSKTILSEVLPYIKKPLMIQGINNNTLDSSLLPELISILDRPCIIAFANEHNYKDIVPLTAKNGHYIVLRSPIDINLCKELNILAADLGQPLDKIIIDTDIGGLGYGLDYGYSIMEKIKLENDEYLNMPIISYAAEESLKTKEAKTDNFSTSWGNVKPRSMMFEIASASAVKAAGANIIVLHNSESIDALRGMI